MTDKEIIQSFLDNNQRGIREAYYAWRMPFEQSLTRLLPNTDGMDDAYQEAFIRLQQHILTERLTADNIEKSLLAYFKTIGRYVALEIINQRRDMLDVHIVVINAILGVAMLQTLDKHRHIVHPDILHHQGKGLA